MIGERVSRYRIIEWIGGGGMGEVYKAEDPELGRHVAIKVLSTAQPGSGDRMRRFEREARAVAQLDHPNILAIHDVGIHRGVPFFVSELLEGESLRDRMIGGVPLKKALDYAIEIAEGLAAAHGKGLVHRDLKPENVFVTRDGHVKILDFGLAKLIDSGSWAIETDAETQTATTDEGSVMGTAAYMSPEQIEGRTVGAQSDIFSFGIVLYELLAVQRPFQGNSRASVSASILRDEPPALSDASRSIPAQVERVVQQCLEKRPEDRFQSARDIALILRAALRRLEFEYETPPPLEAPPRRRTAVLAVGVAAASAAVALIWMSVGLRPDDTSFKGWSSRRLTTEPGWERQPVISPQGDLVAFASNEAGTSDIWLISVHGGRAHRLTEELTEETDPAWYPDGSAIAYVSNRGGGRAIWKVAALGGPSVLVVEDGADPAVSPDGRRIAFSTPGESGLTRIAVAALANPGHITVLTDDDDGVWAHVDPTWSPDGESICYSDRRDLWIVPASGGDAIRLTVDHAVDQHPVWTADGRYILFSSKRGGVYALWRVSARGGDPERITFGTGPEQEPSIAPSGDRIVYTTWSRSRDVVILDLETGERRRLAGASIESAPEFAPDGTAIAFISDRRGPFDLWIQDLDEGWPVGQPRRLTDHVGSVAVPSFSADGAWIAYHRVIPGPETGRDIWMVSPHLGSVVALVDDASREADPAFSPDGSRLAFISDRSGRDHVWVTWLSDNRPVGEPFQLTHGEAADFMPAWAHDSTRLAFVRDQEVWVVAAKGDDQPTPVTNGAFAHTIRWVDDDAALLVAGMWDERRVHLRRVDLEDRQITKKLTPDVVFGDSSAPGLFSVSRDGRFVAYIESVTGGDLWVMESEGGG